MREGIIRPLERACVLVDNCSLYSSLQWRKDGMKLDMGKLKKWLGWQRELSCRFYSGEKPQEKHFFSDFYRRLRNIGYEILVSVHNGISNLPSLMDEAIVSISRSAMICDLRELSMARLYDVFVVVSGHASFLEPLKRCKDEGHFVEVAFVEEDCDRDLMKFADRFRPLNLSEFRLETRKLRKSVC